MSATITINDLKFTIFGSGHDYTLADSGKGGVRVFSHPYVPLDSVHYAGMWYFTVPDENGEPLDAVKDDLAHCEFTPALGATFDTEGEVSLECHYHREYIYDEETVIVDKTVRATVTVVDHGTVSNAAHWYGSWNEYVRCDIYSDGYCFFRPMSTTEVGAYVYASDSWNAVKKVSSIPWRASSLGRQGNSMINSSVLADISEFAFVDASNATIITLFTNAQALIDISALAEWDTSKCEDMHGLLSYCTAITDLSPLARWNTSKVRTLMAAFTGMNGLSNLHGLEDWDVSKVTDMRKMLEGCENLTDISALLNWNTTSLTDLGQFLYMHNGNPKLTSLHGLENWDVSNVTGMDYFLGECKRISSLAELSNWNPKPTSLYQFAYGLSLRSLDGLENFDVSNCQNFNGAFQSNYYLTDCDAVKDWDTSSGTDFGYMLQGAYWLTSIKAFENWTFRGNCGSMFYLASVVSLDNVILDISRVTTTGGMLYAIEKDYSSKLGKYVIKTGTVWYDENGTRYTSGEVDDYDHPLVEVTRDASNAANWTVNGTGLQVFNTDRWSNIPTWN